MENESWPAAMLSIEWKEVLQTVIKRYQAAEEKKRWDVSSRYIPFCHFGDKSLYTFTNIKSLAESKKRA